jgi:hypothetical protein
VRVGMEACGHYPWFEPRLAELGFELWLGMGRRSSTVVRKQKTDRKDAAHILQLLLEDRFPMVGPCGPLHDSNEDGLVGSQNLFRETKWRAFPRPRTGVGKNPLTPATVVRDRMTL